MVRPLFTRRFWSNDPKGSSSYYSNKRSDGYESHELSDGSTPGAKASRLGFRTAKDPYNISALRTQGNESQEDIIAEGRKDNLAQTASNQMSEHNEKEIQGIRVETEVDVSTQHGNQGFQKNWKVV
jgi:hypothetical protein